MSTAPKTDRELSLSANEFIWDSEGSTQFHNLIEKPIIKKLKSKNIQTILDLGCGNGFLTNIIATYGYEVVGLDHSQTGISLAKKQFPSIHFEQHDFQYSLSAEHHHKYDAVVSAEVIEHLLQPRKLMQNAYDALKPGGVFILTTPFHGYWKNLALALTNKFDEHWHPLRDYGHIKFFSKATILDLFSEFKFQNLEFEPVGRLPALAKSMIIIGEKSRG
jgi:2-polyprenyl-3-methyl-5-hydroxy-6-metoxy-1,4-benzoquinol methylase